MSDFLKALQADAKKQSESANYASYDDAQLIIADMTPVGNSKTNSPQIQFEFFLDKDKKTTVRKRCFADRVVGNPKVGDLVHVRFGTLSADELKRRQENAIEAGIPSERVQTVDLIGVGRMSKDQSLNEVIEDFTIRRGVSTGAGSTTRSMASKLRQDYGTV